MPLGAEENRCGLCHSSFLSEEHQKKCMTKQMAGTIPFDREPISHQRCECHKCTQARAKMQLGGMWDLNI